MRGFGRFVWIALTLLVVSSAMVFASMNTQHVPVNLWPLALGIEIRLWILALGTFALGALAGSGLVWLSLLITRLRNMRLSRRLGRAEKKASTATAMLAESRNEE